MSDEYKDIINHPHHVSSSHMPMTLLNRAAQFAPFAALTGYDEAVKETARYRKGEKPDAIIDYPVDATDYELVDIFNWQEEAAGMISQMEFVRRVDVQTETIERYVREG